MSGITRVSVSLPSDLVSDLDYIAGRLGVSRSGLLAQMLVSADLGRLRSLLSAIPDEPSGTDAKRFRGESRSYIADQLRRVIDLQGGLFDDSAC